MDDSSKTAHMLLHGFVAIVEADFRLYSIEYLERQRFARGCVLPILLRAVHYRKRIDR
jgi:hypothetical protein